MIGQKKSLAEYAEVSRLVIVGRTFELLTPRAQRGEGRAQPVKVAAQETVN